MRLFGRLVAVGCAATVLLFAGCQPDEVDPSASLSAAEEQLYQDAFETYSKYFEITAELDQQGGAEVLPDEFRQYVMGPELGLLEDAFVDGWQPGFYYAGENVYRIESWQRGADPGPDDEGWFMGIDVCRYHEFTDFLNPAGSAAIEGDTFFAVAHVQFAKDGGVIKVYNVEHEVVESCPF